MIPRRKTLILLFSLLAITSISGNTISQTVNEKLRGELLAMRERDQQARRECSNGGADERVKCYVRIAETVDKPNTQRIESIFDTCGFPDVKTVGADGVEAFYLILQHSASLSLKQKSLKGINQAFKSKVLSPSDYANFTDRLLLNLGKPQIYGQNFDFKDGKLVMSKTKDIRNIDKRRKRIGLPPIAEYAKMLNEAYNLEVVISEQK